MADFKYTAQSNNGEVINGVVEAANQFEAVEKIRQTCPIIISIEESGGSVVQKKQAVRRIKAKELSLMCNRFSTLLGVGLPIVESVEMLSRQIEDKAISNLLQDVAKNVSMGRSLYASFAAEEGAFPLTFLESVRSGEESGNLRETFLRLSSYYEKSSKTKQKVITSMTYPALTLMVAIIVIIIIMVVAVPVFSRTFESMGTEMPWITVLVIAISDFFVNYGLILLIGIVAAIFAVRLYMRTEKGAEVVSAFVLALPIIGNIIRLSAASQFAHTMSMMIASGMPIISCMETAGRGISNYVMRRDIVTAANEVEEGKSLGVCLGKSKYLPTMLVEMTVMGENTGSLETTLRAVGEFYDNEVDIATTRATSLLEPAIIMILAVLVVMILFSVYLPMFSMYSGY